MDGLPADVNIEFPLRIEIPALEQWGAAAYYDGRFA
jgi:hypothetical protein